MALCKVSMCPPVEETNIDDLLSDAPILNGISNRFVIEFGSDDITNVVQAGANVSENDVIAIMKGIKVKSKIKGRITESYPFYVVGEYDNGIDASAYLMNAMENAEKSNDFDSIYKKLEQSNQVNLFIKNYILRFRFADLATNVIDNLTPSALASAKSTSKMAEKYKDDASILNKRYDDLVANICSKDNVETKCKNDDLLSIKKDLDNARKTHYEKIISQYNNIEKYGYSNGKISDFMLYPLYMEYITSEDFDYDTDNPYIVELFDDITDFMETRSRLETNSTNIDGLVSDFTRKCNKTLKKYWKSSDRDYYAAISRNLGLKNNANDKSLIEEKRKGEKTANLYTQVLDYLKNLTGYSTPASAEEKYKGYDVETIVNMGDVGKSDSEKNSEELLKKLKEIAISFVMLRKIETNPSQNTYYKEYISEDDLGDVFTIKDILKLQMKDADEYSAFEVDPQILVYAEALKKYLGALKSVTDNEARILRELSDRAIAWYRGNQDDIDSGKIFDEFSEAEWPSPTTIYKDGIPHDFYYIEEPKSNEEAMNNVPESSYEYSEDSVKTQHGINSYMYWVRYFTIATLWNCALPMYWGCGIPPPVGPIRLPIIFIPFKVISGRIITVIGLGICGICPFPLIYFVNVGDVPGCIIPAMNIAVDVVKSLSTKMMSISSDAIKEIVKTGISAQDARINEYNKEIEELDKDIYNLSVAIKEDAETKRNLRKRAGKDSTSHKSKNEA